MQPKDDTQANETPDQNALRNVQLLIRWKRQHTESKYALAGRPPIESVGIIGAGMMGTAIAAAAVKHRLRTVLTDTDPQALHSARGTVLALLADDRPPEPDAERAVRQLLLPTAEPADIGRCDLVLESVAEHLPTKRAVYARVEPLLGEKTILGTNTSTIPVAQLVSGLANPERFCGIHFFHPVRHRPLVEIAGGPSTTPATLATAVAFAEAVDKLPIVVGDGPGFMVNRLLLPYLGEALELLLHGAPIEAIERAATDFGMAIGPLRLLDEIGLDTALQGGWVLAAAFPERIVASPLLTAMIKAGHLGRKSGTGFFTYSNQYDDQPTTSAGVHEIIADWARPPRPFTEQTIINRLLLLMVLEATRILQERLVCDPRDVDLGVILGLGFPAARGGLLRWADTLGAARIVQMLGQLESLGTRAGATPMLLEMADKEKRFYEGVGDLGFGW